MDASTFITDFSSEPSVLKLEKQIRALLIKVCEKFEIELPKRYVRKSELVDTLSDFCIDEGILKLEDIVKYHDVSGVDSQTLLELECMRNLEKDKQREFEIKQREFEIKQREFEIKQRKSERKHELEVAQLKNEALKDKSNKSHEAMRLVPTFDETRIEEFFVAFEKLADKLQWEESLQTVLLQTKCIGKAQDAINALDADQCKSYDTMKKHILNAYELVPESYRAKFRSLTRINDETYVEFAQKKSKTFQRWLDSRNIDGDFDKLKNLVLVEEFKKQLPTEIRTHLNDLDIHELKTCAVKADEFALSHKLFAHSNRTAQRQNHAGKWKGTPPHQNDANKSNNLSNVQCFSCKNFGHYKNTCPQLKKKTNANSESVSPETDKKKQNTCAKCKRCGHWTKDCWSDKQCTICNNVGHIEEVCKSRPKSAGLVALASLPIENNNQNYVAEVTRRLYNVTVNPVNVKALIQPGASKTDWPWCTALPCAEYNNYCQFQFGLVVWGRVWRFKFIID